MSGWVEVSMGADSRRWEYAFGAEAALPMTGGRIEMCPTLELRCGDLLRVALLSGDVAGSEQRVKSVAVNMARWEDDAQFIPAVRLYVWGLVSFTDGPARQTLCLLIVDLDGTVSGMFPIDLLETS